MIKNRILGGLTRWYSSALTREELVARTIIGCRAIAPIVLMPATPRVTARLVKRLRRKRACGETFRGKFAGVDISIVSTGIGAPSAEVKMVAALAAGGRTFIRVDFCGGLAAGLKIGDVFVAAEAIPDDGVARACGEREAICAAPRLLSILGDLNLVTPVAARLRPGKVITVDTFFHQSPAMLREWATVADAVDMETSVIYNLAARAGAEALALLTVSDLPRAGISFFEPNDYPFDRLYAGMEALTEVTAALVRRLK